jgi:tetratricopeptide (TPR) repeat protein
VRRLGTIGMALALAAAVACGGGSKKKPTTPGAGSGSGSTADPGGMNDTGDPTGDGVPTTGGGGGSAGGGGDTGGGGGGGDLGGGGGDGGDPVAAGDPEPPPIVPPNLDIPPDQARTEVDRHLRQAKAMLAAAKPDPDSAIIEAKGAGGRRHQRRRADRDRHAYYLKRLTDTAEVILDTLYNKRRAAVESNAYLNYVYGLVYDRNNEPTRAFAAYKKAVSLDGNFASALVNLGVHQLENKQYGDAVESFERLTGQLGRTDAATWSSLGSAYRGQAADYDPGSANKNQLLGRAENAYKRALAANQSYGPAYYNLGLLYLDADPFPDGGGAMDTLVRLNKAKTYVEEYKNMAGVDLALYDERLKDVTKLIKREEKKRKKAGGG